jgi:hypothetical protein
MAKVPEYHTINLEDGAGHQRWFRFSVQSEAVG